jgi:hypothetical protein
MAAVNGCGAFTTRSDTLSNILLIVTKENLYNRLIWNNNGKFYYPDAQFDIYRGTGFDDPTYLATSSSPVYYDDFISSFTGHDISSRFCYLLEAEISSEGKPGTKIISNKECLYIKPEVFIPNAIAIGPNIPNDDVNKEFKPLFSFIPENYLLIIYDRNGRKIFESRNPERGWQGKDPGSNRTAGGTYIYYLEFNNPGQKVKRKKGVVTVVYSR